MPGATREQILMQALDALMTAGNGVVNGSDVAADAAADAADADAVRSACNPLAHDTSSARAIVPRGTASTACHIVIYRCDACRIATVETLRGSTRVRAAEFAAAECDAVIVESGQRNRATIPPSMRQAVLVRDRHRCSAPGCRNTHFLEVHHIHPREKGGRNRADNLRVLCSSCHRLWHEKKVE